MLLYVFLMFAPAHGDESIVFHPSNPPRPFTRIVRRPPQPAVKKQKYQGFPFGDAPFYLTSPPLPELPKWTNKAAPSPFRKQRPSRNETHNRNRRPVSGPVVKRESGKRKGQQLEIMKSIEMEFDPVSGIFVPVSRREELMASDTTHPKFVHKKRNNFASNETTLLSPETKKNLNDIFKKFEKEQESEKFVLRGEKNFQTGRFKIKHDYTEAKPEKSTNSTANRDLFGLICDVKYLGPGESKRFSRNAETRGKEAKSINLYVDDPNFLKFLYGGKWSNVPLMEAEDNNSKTLSDCN